MSPNGNDTAEKQVSSEFLQHLLGANKVTLENAQWANQFPTPEMQSMAIHRYRNGQVRLRAQIEEELLPAASEAPETPINVPPAAQVLPRIPDAAPKSGAAAGSDLHQQGWLQELFHEHVPYGGIAVKLWMTVKAHVNLKKVLGIAIAAGFVFGTLLIGWGVLVWAGHQLASLHPSAAPSEPSSSAASNPEAAARKPSSFQLLSATYVDGNKLELHWPDLGAGYRYKVFENCHPGDTAYTPKPVTDQVVDTPGARVNLPDDAFCPEPDIQVQAILPNGAAGPITGPVKFRVSPLNSEMYSVEPLEMEATAGTENGRTAAARSGGAPVNRRPRESGSGSLSKKEYQSPPGQVASGDQYGQPLHPQGVRAPLRVADVPGSSPTGVPPSSQASKSSVFSAFAHALIKNSDGAVITAVPNVAVGAGLVAVKNAAVSAHDERAPSTVRPVPVPSGFTGRYVDERTIYLEWNPVGPGYTYAVFASPIEPLDFTYNDPENDDPIRDPRVNWNIPKGKGSRFLFEVRAVDPQGRQSASSTRIEVDVL